MSVPYTPIHRVQADGLSIFIAKPAQRTHRSSCSSMLAIWGKHDPFFIPPGAEAYRRDNPNASVRFLDTGHFATETHLEEIANAIHQFLAAKL